MPKLTQDSKIKKILNSYKVALVYDKVNTKYGGAEWVLQALHTLFPNAPLFTSLYLPSQAKWAKKFTVVPSILNTLFFFRKHHQLLVPLMPMAFESLQLRAFDIIISVSSGEAKGVLTTTNQLHICYLLTPPRYLYSYAGEYRKAKPWLQLPGIKPLVTSILTYLQWWDRAAMWRPDTVFTISKLISNRLKTIYGRQADILMYPPLPPQKTLKNIKNKIECKYLLVLSRLVPYKKVTVAIDAALRTNTVLIIAGEGEAKRSLIGHAGKHAVVRNSSQTLELFLKTATAKTTPTIFFVGEVDNDQREWLLTHAWALLMPGKEDFGITALEAVAAGILPIIHKDSGVAEVLADGKTALHTTSDTVEDVVQAVRLLERSSIDTAEAQKIVDRHSFASFTSQMQKSIYDSIIQNNTIIQKEERKG